MPALPLDSPPPGNPIGSDLALGFRFGVFFMHPGGLINPLDTRFQKVSGLGVEVGTQRIAEGGQNHHVHKLPDRVEQGNLILERGLTTGSPLDRQVDQALSRLQFDPGDVLITLFDAAALPLSAWLFLHAYPVRWTTADLDAAQTAVVIDTLELAYTRMRVMRV